jgi:hypothetical protein
VYMIARRLSRVLASESASRAEQRIRENCAHSRNNSSIIILSRKVNLCISFSGLLSKEIRDELVLRNRKVPTATGAFLLYILEDGFTGRPLTRTSKCRWGPVESPVEPIAAITWPRLTLAPART